jgi:hypothetical protein
MRFNTAFDGDKTAREMTDAEIQSRVSGGEWRRISQLKAGEHVTLARGPNANPWGTTWRVTRI